MAFKQRTETFQYNAALIITDFSLSKERPCQELSLKTLQQRCWYENFCCFYKILNISVSEEPLFKCFYTKYAIKFRQKM